jgi:AcrR family transcriptional regulator
MSSSDSAAEPVSTEDPMSWRELAVARVADPARLRAETRVQSFLDAALELMNSDSGKEFTVQEVVERSGQSLRSFYQYFDGKHRLLLALFEESVRSTTELLRDRVAEEGTPPERLHRFVIEYYRLCRPSPKERPSKKGPIPPAMVDFAQQLLTEYPKEAAQAFVPLLSLFEELLDEAAEAGFLRPGLGHSHIAGVALQAIMFNTFASTISGASVRSGAERAAEDLWDLLLNGIAAERTA